MNVFDCITTRRSVYKFEKKEVDDKLIGVILYMATHAPSAGNVQEWHFIVVKDEEQKKNLAVAALNQSFIAEAPVVIVVCSDLERMSLRYDERGKALYAIQDTANACMLILLAANALGLGSCWVGAFDEYSVRKTLEIPDNLRPVSIIPIGYAAEKTEMPTRMQFEDVTSFDKYGKKYDLAALQPGARLGEDVFEPLSSYIEKVLKEQKKEKEDKPKERKKLTFEEFLRRLST